MKVGRIIHQQVMQLRCHFLACLGLIMVLPVEEAIVSWHQGDGFYSAPMVILSTMFAPLLAGLIACAAVQADLDEKRDIFWRSKPVRVDAFITLKYFVGLVIALFVLGCPVVFGLLGDIFYPRSNDIVAAAKPIFLNILFISMMAYSVCFLCNVLIRKTARGWLAGMAIAILLLLVPFVFPLNLKDFATEFLNVISWIYVSITLGAFIAAFILSLIAVAYNWHLRMNLKGLLWSTTAVMFGLILLFTHQVANIKVLDEVTIPAKYAYIGSLYTIDDTIHLDGFFKVLMADGKIQLEDIKPEPEEIHELRENTPRLYPVHRDLDLAFYPNYEKIIYQAGENTFSFHLSTYSLCEEVRKNVYQYKLKHAYLCCYQLIDELYQVPVSALDLSDCVDSQGRRKVGLRRINDKLVVLIQDSIAIVQIKADGALELIDKKVDGLRGYSPSLTSLDHIFKIRLIPFGDIPVKDRVKLSIDVNYCYYPIYGNWRFDEIFSRYSIVDVNNDTIRFCTVNDFQVSRFEVVQWDDEFVYCRFKDARPFTLLEGLFGTISVVSPDFIQDGKLYAYGRQKLLVFDIRSARIRKLGHFERLREDYAIQDIEVLGNGDILLCAETEKRIITKSADPNRKYDDHFTRKGYLTLLENPE